MEKKMPIFKKQTKKEKIITILYFISILLFVIAYSLNIAKVITKDYCWLFALSFNFIIQHIRLKQYNNKWSKRYLIFFIIGIILGLLELLFL